MRSAGSRWFRRRLVALVAAVLVVSVAGCGGCRQQTPLVIAFDDVPDSLDPHLQNRSVTWSVLSNVYDSLVRFSPTMELEPGLAAAWEHRDGHWLVTLRPGVRFHDGSPLRAEDVVASLERARDHPRSRVRYYLSTVRAIRSLDDLSVELEPSGGAPNLLNRLAFLAIVPAAQAGQEEITSPIGTGPYRVVGRTPSGDLELAGWPAWSGTPEINRVVFTFYDDEVAASEAFFTGHADVLQRVPDDQLAAVDNDPALRAVPQPRLAVQMLAVVPSAAQGELARALGDPRVRRAMPLALDRTHWTSSVFRGNATVASQYVHPVIFGFDPDLQPVPYDPDEARRLLAEAGFPGGFAVTLGHGLVSTGIVEAIVADLGAVGIDVRVEAAPFSEILRRARAGEIPLVFYAWSCSTGDASDFLNSSLHTPDRDAGLGSDNYTGYSDARTDALLEQADREADRTVRRALLQQAQRRALEALPVLPLTTRWAYMGVGSRVEVVTRHDERLLVASWRWRH